MKHIGTLARTIATFTLYGLAAALPIFFLPLTPDFFDTNKLLLIVLAAALVAACWAIHAFARKTIRLTTSPTFLPVLGYAGALLLSTFFATPYRFEVFVGRGLLILALTLVFIAGTAVGKANSAKPFLLSLSVGASLLVIASLAQAVGFGPSKVLSALLAIDLQNTPLFSLAGSLLTAVLVLLPLAIMHIVELFATKKSQEKLIHGVFAGIMAAGVIVNGYFMLPGKIGQLFFLPLSASWSIATDVLKNPRTALLGVGPESYSVAFTQFRPAALNLSKTLWNARFSTGRIEPLHIFTTLGFLGVGAWLLMMLMGLKSALPLREETRALSVLLLALFAEQLLLPASVVTIALTYLTLILLVLIQKSLKDSRVADVTLHMMAVNVVAPEAGESRMGKEGAPEVFSTIFSVLIVAGVATALFALGKVYAAENLFYQSLAAAAKNDGLQAYNLQSALVTRMPIADRYRRAFASTNFLLADAIAKNPKASDKDKENISPLLQQAIREAKTATDLDPRKTINWETLAEIYKGLLGVAQGADGWTVAAYVRAIQTDASNPSLRFALGSVYMSLQNYELATRLFQQTIELKPDWANAYYNLANVYKMRGESVLALDALKQTQALIPAASEDQTKLTKEVEELQKQVDQKKAAAEKAQSQQAAAAAGKKQTQAAVPEGQIKLPENLGLPEEQAPTSVPEGPNPSTSPSPTATPGATPEPTPAP